MLPWLFVVLVLLNAGLFFWGYQREKSLEPPSTPVPQGRYEIRLLGEIPQDSRQAPNAGAPGAALADESAVSRRVGEAGEVGAVGSAAADESGRLNGAAIITTEADVAAVPAVEAGQDASELGSSDMQAGDSAPESVDIVEPLIKGTNVPTKRAAPDEVVDQTDPADSRVSASDAEEPVVEETLESAPEDDAGSVQSSAEPSPQSGNGLRSDELEAEAPSDSTDIVDTRPPAPPVVPQPVSEERVRTVPAPPSEDGK